jgi:Shikimate kinase
MQTNLTLIGMPGAGKSTVGIILAKNLSLGFIDTDVLIQINQQQSLQQILDASGHLALRAIEEAEICKLNVTRHVIATGGSATYSHRAMTHLHRISLIVFLEVSFAEINRRIRDFSTRGIAKAKHQSLRELFDERQALYKKYADLTVACDNLDQEDVARAIIRSLPADRRILSGANEVRLFTTGKG